MRAHLTRPMRARLTTRLTRAGPILAALAGISVTLLGCGDPSRPAEPSDGPSDISVAQAQLNLLRRVSLMDACDPTTFNAAIGAGTCVRQGGVTFAKFLAQITKHKKIGAWHFAPPNLNARAGQSLLAINRGGEVHTFTRVAAFGGGIVAILNQLSGNPVVAPECTTLEPGDFVAPGATFKEEVEAGATQRFQCCIHPWMRTIVHTH